MNKNILILPAMLITALTSVHALTLNGEAEQLAQKAAQPFGENRLEAPAQDVVLTPAVAPAGTLNLAVQQEGLLNPDLTPLRQNGFRFSARAEHQKRSYKNNFPTWLIVLLAILTLVGIALLAAYMNRRDHDDKSSTLQGDDGGGKNPKRGRGHWEHGNGWGWGHDQHGD